MRFVKATDVNGKTIVINAELITEAIPRTTDHGILDIYFNTNDGTDQAQNTIKGNIESFLEGVNVTGTIEAV